MDFFGEDPVSKLSLEELSRAAGGTGVGVLPEDQSFRIRAGERLQREQRPYSVRSEDAGKYILGGELVRAGIEMGISNPKIKVPLGRYGLVLDAVGNAFGANSSTDAGSDPYGRVIFRNGKLEQVSPSGSDSLSQFTNALEGGISALQWTKVGAIPASAFAGEFTESLIHQAEAEKAPILAEIAGREGDYASVENAVRDLGILNSAQAEPGKISGDFWSGIRQEKKAIVDAQLDVIRQAIASKDPAQVDEAAKIIPGLAEFMDAFGADMEAVQTSSQEYTWPAKRLQEWTADEAPNFTTTHFFSPDRFIDTVFSGNLTNHGVLDYFNPSGKNMQQYAKRQAWAGKDKRTRTQGPELLKELHQRALEVTDGVDPRKARDSRQRMKANLEAQPVQHYYGDGTYL